MSTIPIYSIERQDGLESKFSNRITWANKIEIDTKPLKQFELSDRLLTEIAAKREQIDLYFIKSIFVSTGMNLNDDVFTTYETWAARHTPIHKPFNLSHKADKIIGHITSSYVVSDSNKEEVIDDNTACDKLPPSFHIVTGAALYKFLNDPRQEEAAQLIDGIKQGKWYVSMEALFKNFDYWLMDEVNKENSKIVARNEQTAFLTKHLRFFGGTGTFEQYKVGRVLKHIVFSGKGLVETPANPNSIIFNSSSIRHNFCKYTQGIIEQRANSVYKKTTEPMESKMSEELKVQNTKLTEDNKALAAKVAELEKSINMPLLKVTAQEIDVKAHIEKVSKLETELTKATTGLTAAETKVKELTAALDETTKARDVAVAELNTARLAETVRVRVAAIVKDKLYSEANATALATSLNIATLSDDQFKVVLAALPNFVPATDSKKTEAAVLDAAKKEKEEKAGVGSTHKSVDSDFEQVQAEILKYMLNSDEENKK